MYRQILAKVHNVKCHKNLWAVLELLHGDRLTGRQSEKNRRFLQIYLRKCRQTEREYKCWTRRRFEWSSSYGSVNTWHRTGGKTRDSSFKVDLVRPAPVSSPASLRVVPWWWRLQTPLKCRSISTKLHGATSQKTVIFMSVIKFPPVEPGYSINIKSPHRFILVSGPLFFTVASTDSALWPVPVRNYF
jgi:hypothetical protein